MLDLTKQTDENNDTYLARLANILSGLREKQKNGTITAEEKEDIQLINTQIFNNEKLKTFTYSFLKVKYGTYFTSQNNGDLVNEAFAELFKNFHLYNGNFDVTTFARPHIIHGAQNFISFLGNKTAYENEIYNKVHREIQKLIASGYEESEITVSLLMNYLNLSQAQIAGALDAGKSKIEEYNPDLEIVSNKYTPEQEMIRQYENSICKGILADLPVHERYALIAISGSDGVKMTYQQLGEDPTFINIIRKIGMGHIIKQGQIPKEKCKKIYFEALNHAKASPFASERMNLMKKNSSNNYGEIINLAKKEAINNEQILMEVL